MSLGWIVKRYPDNLQEGCNKVCIRRYRAVDLVVAIAVKVISWMTRDHCSGDRCAALGGLILTITYFIRRNIEMLNTDV